MSAEVNPRDIVLFTANNYVRFSLILDIYLLRSSAHVYFGLLLFLFYSETRRWHWIFRPNTNSFTISFAIHSLEGTTLLIWMEPCRWAKLPCQKLLNDCQVLSWLMMIKMKCGKWWVETCVENTLPKIRLTSTPHWMMIRQATVQVHSPIQKTRRPWNKQFQRWVNYLRGFANLVSGKKCPIVPRTDPVDTSAPGTR